MFCLSTYDISGIQDFVFSSRKTRENVGASFLVSNVFGKYLDDAIREVVPGAVSEPDPSGVFLMLSGSGPDAEVIYVGGGNALIAFRNMEVAVEVTRRLSRRLLEETGGTLGMAVAHLETEGSDFQEDMRSLRRILEEKKFSLPYSRPLGGLAVTRDGVSDGLPAVDEDERGDWISGPAKLKRAAIDSFAGFEPANFRFPSEFDRLGRNREKGDSFLGIVHIDGNGMGQRIDDHVSGADGWEDATRRLRDFSLDIRKTYRSAFSGMTGSLARSLVEDGAFSAGFGLEPGDLPLRPLVLSGDDVTFVCDGRLAFDLASRFLASLHSLQAPDGKPYSACAGIAVVKPHFPFYRAYGLAAQLCDSAKATARYSARQSGGQVGSWFDYHIVQSGLPLDLYTLRTSSYNYSAGRELVVRDEQVHEYNLLWRPYLVAGGQDQDRHSWSTARGLLKDMLASWPRSRLKGFREALGVSNQEARAFYSECESRGLYLPGNEGVLFEGDRTRWFDLLEMMDLYLEIPALSEGGKEL